MSQLTHVELLYRPGERELAARVLQLLGCEPVDRGGTWFTSFIAPDGVRDYANNVFYASEVSPEQWQLEQALTAQLAASQQEYVTFMRDHPQRSAHFGFRVADRAALDELADRVATAEATDPQLKGRVRVDGCFEPDAPGTIATNMVQLFIWTDVVASGLLALGQHIEVQWHLPQP